MPNISKKTLFDSVTKGFDICSSIFYDTLQILKLFLSSPFLGQFKERKFILYYNIYFSFILFWGQKN